MGATTISQELTCPISPARMFKALIVESNALIPKLLPQFIKSVELVQGDGGAGSIEQVNFTEASHFKYVKHRINGLNNEKFECHNGLNNEKFECQYTKSIEVKFEAASDGGSVAR
ncbi:hypothetical protein BT93_A0297 [Corymbia citriodora subsp. variegata]|nr:hypothetical protein BT93_A0297 [Corymbia citriodora subsp. variegata]